MNTAPILLFTYKRLIPLKKTVEALKKNDLAGMSDLFVFSDGPKTEADRPKIREVRAFLKTIEGFNSIRITESENNLGLANSIIGGVTEVLKNHEKVIVLEDDLLTTTNFLTFMNDGLDTFITKKKVFSIAGFSFDLDSNALASNEAYFLNRGWPWGWATWKNRWEEIDWQVSDYKEFRSDKEKRSEFSKGGSDLNAMLKKQMNGELDSWAIRWIYHQFKVKGLTLYPAHSKVYNNGFDQFATHTKGSEKRYKPHLDIELKNHFVYPETVELTEKYQGLFLSKMGIKARIISKIETIMMTIFKVR